MIDFDILHQLGSTNDRLRDVFTAVIPSEADAEGMDSEKKADNDRDVERRKKFEDRIRNRLNEHIPYSLRNYALYAAADLAWDTPLITKEVIPLLMYAQGKINVSDCYSTLKQLPGSSAYLKKDPAKPHEPAIDLPKFFDFHVSLGRSIVTRRLGAQSNKYNNLWPFYKYEARSTGMVGKLRADALSQRVDIMADQGDYRHHDTQVMRDMFLYGDTVDFVSCSWACEKQYRKKKLAEEFATDEKGWDIEEVITKEWLPFINPHRSRIFADNAYPLASINTDTGVRYIGFWDVRRYSDLKHNPAYYNRDSIPYGSALTNLFSQYKGYFDNYYCNIRPPSSYGWGDPAGANDRANNIGFFTESTGDESVFVTEYFEKLVPKEFGFGDYPYEVWIRFVVASDCTVIYAEFLPSTPGAYCGFNCNDNRQTNISIMHESMVYEQHLANLMTAMLLNLQGELLKIIGINTDCLGRDDGSGKQEAIDYLRSVFTGKNWSTVPVVWEYSMNRLQNLGIKASDILTLNEARTSQSINQIFQAIAQLLGMVERLMAMSPAEQGQPAPREISATEVNEIASTTSTVYNFISDAIDEYKSAKKRIIYEALVCCAKETEMQVPVINRYSNKTIELAGFKPVEDENEDYSDPNYKRRTLLGSVNNLRHDFIFTTRDGSERSVNTQAANTLVQLLAQIVNVPTVLQAMGKEKLYMVVTEIFRMSGAGVDVILELAEGEDDSMGVDQMQQIQQFVDQLSQGVQQLAQATQQNAQGIAEQEAVNQQQEEALKAVLELAKQVQALKQSFVDSQEKESEEEAKASLELSVLAAKSRQEIEAATARTRQDVAAAEAKREIESRKARQELIHRETKHDQEIRHREEKAALERRQERQLINS